MLRAQIPAQAKEEKEELEVLLKVRALLATAESSEFEGETQAFYSKAMSLAERYEIDEELLAFPREDLKVAVVMAELGRLKEVVQAYEDEDETGKQDGRVVGHSRRVRRCPGSGLDLLCLPLKRLPYGLLVNVGPIFIAILAGIVLREGFPRLLLAGCAVAFIGAGVIGISTSHDAAEGAGERSCASSPRPPTQPG